MSRRRSNRKKQNRQVQGRHLITQLNPRSPISEQYRTLRTNIEFSSIDEPIQTIVITSSIPGEGKSLTSANLAIVYAQQGKKVLLVDADMRKPTVHYTFRLNNLQGLSNLLIQDDTIEASVSMSGIEHLDIMSSGPIPPNPSELLGSQRMKVFIEEAKKNYDIILFDTPPVNVVPDAQILANIVDGTILVVRSGQTEIDEAKRAKETLETANSKLLGAVINDLDKKTSHGYHYYYAT